MTLMQNLIDWQQKQARKEHLEPYMVLQFGTIKEIVRVQPKTQDELIRIKGIGPAKVRKYGDAILTLVRGNGITEEKVIEQSSGDLFSEADAVNEAALTSKNPSAPDVAFDPETGEVIEDVGDDAVSVTEFVTMLDTMLRTNFRSVRIQGEVVGFKRNASGHAYFEVKDRASVLRCMVFSSSYDLSGVALEDGMEIIITGYPNYHKQYGFGFVGTAVELYGEGALKKAYDDLKKKLEKEGLLADQRKRALPQLPEKIGLITSKTGAAIGDFTTNVGQYGYKIIFHQSRVEGAGALTDLKNALTAMAKKDLDLLVIVRGGGSLESLQAFNNEKIVQLIADFPVPVVAGVGHEQDETLTTLVADRGVSTPTAAARAVRENWDKCGEYVQSREQYLLTTYDNALRSAQEEVAEHERTLTSQLGNILDHFKDVFQRFALSIQKIDSSIRNQKTHINNYGQQISRGFVQLLQRTEDMLDMSYGVQQIKNSIAAEHQRLNFAQKAIAHNDPEKNLRLGYSITRNKKGKIVRSVEDVKKDDELSVQVADGEIKAGVRE